MVIIKIKELQAQTILGIYDWEKKAKRPVVLNIEMHAPDVGSDDIKDAVDYEMIEREVIKRLEAADYNLVETLAADIGRLVLSLDARISKVIVEADKPGALKQAKSVSVTCEQNC